MKLIELENLLAGLEDWWLENQDFLDEETYNSIKRVIAEEGLSPEDYGLFSADMAFTIGIGPFYDWILGVMPEILRVIANRGPVGGLEKEVMDAAKEVTENQP